MAELVYDMFNTSWGWVGVVGSELGIRYATLPEATPDEAMERLQPAMKYGTPPEQPGAFEDFRRQLEEFFRGERVEWDVRLDMTGATEFFQRAWTACQSIPVGETRSYQWLAEQAGRPRAPRAAGQAMARNRVPLVVPCHRVIGADGGLHGFGKGQNRLDLKARLLNLEQTMTAAAAR